MLDNVHRKKGRPDLIMTLQNIVRHHKVGSQKAVCDLLHQQGIVVNQVRVSRLLRKLGVVKARDGEQHVYQLPTEPPSLSPNDLLKHVVTNVAHNGTMLVIQTLPGSAQLVARLLDQHQALGILGTVAGDDTVFVAPVDIHEINNVHQNVCQYLFGAKR